MYLYFITGRVVVAGLGGGIKEDIHWVHDFRRGPTDDSPPLEERVIQIIPSPAPTVRTANLALVGSGDFLKLILATENMKAGDILKTSMFIPRIPGETKLLLMVRVTEFKLTCVLLVTPFSGVCIFRLFYKFCSEHDCERFIFLSLFCDKLWSIL